MDGGNGDDLPCAIVDPDARAAMTGVYFNDFEGVVGPEWSDTDVSKTPSGKAFLGELGNQEVALTLGGLKPHALVIVSFDLYVLRSWDGDGPSRPNFWGLF